MVSDNNKCLENEYIYEGGNGNINEQYIQMSCVNSMQMAMFFVDSANTGNNPSGAI